jgi:opacity protein-like surface antigen
MNQRKTLFGLALSAAIVILYLPAQAQSTPTATQQLQLSAFGGATGAFTDLRGGKNLDITAGADLTLSTFRLLRPSLELRGSYPIDSGHISSQKNFLGGVRVEHTFGRLRPYANFLIGLGEIDYNPPAPAYPYTYPYNFYLKSSSVIYSVGGGVDYDLTSRWAVKADAQFQHWDTPTTASGAIHPTALTLGAVYRFDFNPRHHRSR